MVAGCNSKKVDVERLEQNLEECRAENKNLRGMVEGYKENYAESVARDLANRYKFTKKHFYERFGGGSSCEEFSVFTGSEADKLQEMMCREYNKRVKEYLAEQKEKFPGSKKNR